MPEPLGNPSVPNAGLILPTSRTGGDLASGSVSSDPLAALPWSQEDLPGIPTTSVPGDWAPVIPFSVEIGALADLYVLDIGVDLGTMTHPAVGDMSLVGLPGIDLGLQTIGAEASAYATAVGTETDRDLGEITLGATAELTPTQVGLGVGTLTMDAIAELAPTALTVNPDPSGSIGAVAEMTPFGMAIDLSFITTSAAAEINQIDMALDLGTITTPATAESGYTDLSSVPVATDATYDFNISNGELPSGWAKKDYGAAGKHPVVVSNAARNQTTTATNTNNQGAAIWLDSPAASDNFMVRANIGSAPTGLFSALILRSDDSFNNMLFWVITTDTGNRGIWSNIGGTFTRRADVAPTSVTTGTVCAFKAVGNVYTAVRTPNTDGTGGTSLGSWTDSGNLFTPGSTKRYGGIYQHSDCDFFGTQGWSPTWDNFRINDLV